MEKLNKKQIIDLLPHREPMLLIDELYDIKKLYSATAVVNVKKDSFFVQGHFPGQPVMPGVLIVESFGQAAAALTAQVTMRVGILTQSPELIRRAYLTFHRYMPRSAQTEAQHLIAYVGAMPRTMSHGPPCFQMHFCSNGIGSQRSIGLYG